MVHQKNEAISDTTSNDSSTSCVLRIDIKHESIYSQENYFCPGYVGSKNKGMMMDFDAKMKTESVEMNIKKELI